MNGDFFFFLLSMQMVWGSFKKGKMFLIFLGTKVVIFTFYKKKVCVRACGCVSECVCVSVCLSVCLCWQKGRRRATFNDKSMYVNTVCFHLSCF